MRNLILISLGILVISCGQHNDRNAHTDIISIPKGIDKVIATDDLFDNFEFIPLETTEHSLFGDVDKIMIYDDKFYIKDKTKTRKVIVFNSNGKFSHTIGEIGHGPEEYTKLEDFTIDEQRGQVIILSYPSIIYRYDLEGNFIERKKISDHPLWHICYDSSEGFLCSTDYQSTESDYLIYHYDKDFSLKDKKIKTNDFVGMPPLNIEPFIKDGDKISYFDFYTSTLYWDILNSEGKTITFDFGDKKVPFEVYKNPMQFFEDQQMYNFFITAVINKGVFWSSYSNHGQGANTLITNITDGGEKRLLKNSRFFDILCCHDGYFYQSYSSLTFLEGNFNFTPQVATNYPVDFDSNPVILRFKEKQVLN